MPNEPSIRINLFTRAAIAAVFERRRGAARTLYYTQQTQALAQPWIEFLHSKNECALLCSPEELLQQFPQAAEGLLLQTERAQPKAPSHSDVLSWQRAGEALVCLQHCDQAALQTLLPLIAEAGFKNIILDEQQPYPCDKTWSHALGALELLKLYRVASLRSFLKSARAHFLTVGISHKEGKSLNTLKPPRAPGRPVLLVLDGQKSASPQTELTVKIETPDTELPAFFRVLQAANTGVK